MCIRDRISTARERIETLASKFGTTADVLRQANNIPQRTRLRAGSTILVPKTSATMNSDITQEIADSATMLLEADRPERVAKAVRRVTKGGKVQAAPISLVKPRIQRGGNSRAKARH